MTKTYDPAYSTTVSFNTPIMLHMVEKRDIGLVKHWLENAEPNKKMATAAFTKAIDMQWIELLDVLWESDWLTQKGMLTIGGNHAIAITMYGRNLEFHDSKSHQWLMSKLFSSLLTKSQQNALFLSFVELAISRENEYYWNIFYSENLILKGKTAEKIISHCMYVLARKNNEYNNYDDAKVKIRDKLKSILSNKNAVQIDISDILSVLCNTDEQDFDLFFELIETPKLIISEKDIFLLAIKSSIFFKSVIPRFREYKQVIENNPDFSNFAFDRTMKALVKAGLPEKIIFDKSDLEHEYIYEFSTGYISLSGSFRSTSLSMEARQFPRTYAGFAVRDKIAHVEFNTGVAIYSELHQYEHNSYDKVFREPTKEEYEEMTVRFSKFRKEVLNLK